MTESSKKPGIKNNRNTLGNVELVSDYWKGEKMGKQIHVRPSFP